MPKSADRSSGEQPGPVPNTSSHNVENGVGQPIRACAAGSGDEAARVGLGSGREGSDAGAPADTKQHRSQTHASVSQREKRAKTRLCVVHRVELPTEDLIRFVAGPTGAMVADLKSSLPGRGVWVRADRASVAEAVARKAFDRGLKRTIEPNPNLPDEVQALLVKRVCNGLSLANKAGAALAGFTKVDLAIQKQSLAVLVHASDAAVDGRDKLSRKFRASCLKSAPEQRIVTILTVSQLSLAMGRSNVVHAGLTDSGMAKTFLFEAKRLQRYGHGFAVPTTDGKHHVGNE